MPARKGKREAEAPAAEVKAPKVAKAAESSGSSKTEKRGRGRPRLPDSAKKTKAYVPSGRPRGRPKKTSSQKAAPAKKAKKAAAKPTKAAKTAPVKKAKAGTAKGRGRPRKNVQPAEESAEDASAEAKSDSDDQ